MIISDDNVFLDIVIDDEKFSCLKFSEVEELLHEYKYKNNEMLPKEMISIPNCYAYFNKDDENNRFTCKIYKTLLGSDRWIMLMYDENEGYALYQNPENKKYQLAWYHTKLEKPLSPSEEKKIMKCYCPIGK
ncbi:MAG: hypothetical protein IJI98_04155 [Methanosphaera sp.]|uniref:hypothetical protein n=1 Tax=Methanosphaera sp. ISO3-F5 TaxID=1452353 RepID=UPI002B263234|nr:hypothetical protein [Methanosphaera sp. ISO3-F5]MBR0471871.1 hypothetical protein [Methanosphaera sp.]WQH64838.1 hypothetical protein PXD04_03370 [Methanosphaera sp. ISO3-F5]